ncbi:hypothetical protein AWC20_12520 [Mycobacterium parmense]|nr:hypothetical protein AWC20_12520 [Mycobacterium parmense]
MSDVYRSIPAIEISDTDEVELTARWFILLCFCEKSISDRCAWFVTRQLVGVRQDTVDQRGY